MKLWVQQEFSVLHPFGQVWTILIVIYSQCGVPGPFRHTFFFLCDHLRQSCGSFSITLFLPSLFRHMIVTLLMHFQNCTTCLLRHVNVKFAVLPLFCCSLICSLLSLSLPYLPCSHFFFFFFLH